MNPRHAKARRNLVLHEMLDQHDILPSDYRAAIRAPLPKPQDVHLPGTQGPSPYFVNYVKQQLVDRYGASRVFGGGLKVKTTIDLRLQKLAHAAIDSTLTNPDGPTAALVAIDPRTGAVLTMIGGANYHKSQFNLAVQGERQPGSSFKPFVLATALSQGISPATMLTSKPQVISLGDKDWYVHNYEGAYLGPINLTEATVESDNTVYAQLTRIVGPGNIVKTAHRLGITSPLQNYFAIGLGVEAVNPLEMARAYGAFANGGMRIDGRLTGNRPVAIASVNGVPNSPQPQRVLTPEVDAYLNQILQGVVTSGTGRKAALSDRPVAGKTGTTENFGDAWFVGYTPQLVTAVWVGYPNRYVPMLSEYHGKAVAGGTFPAEIWKKFMTSALPLLDDQPETFPAPPLLFQSPRRVVYRDNQIELDNGYCRNTSEIVYFGSAGPARRATCKKNEVEVPRVVGMTLAEAKARLLQQPLLASVVYKPAAPRQRVDIVVDQFPSTGGLSSWSKVTLVMAKPLHGVVPVGRRARPARGAGAAAEGEARRARRRARRREAGARARTGAAARGGGRTRDGRRRAARPRLDPPAEEARAGLRVAPVAVHRLRDPDPRPPRDRRVITGGAKLERRLVERQAVVRCCDPERLREAAGARAEQARVVEAAPLAHLVEPVRRLERAHERGRRGAAHQVQAPVDAVGAIDVGVARRAEHGGVAGGRAAERVRGGVLPVVGLDLDDPPAHSVHEQRHADQLGRDVVHAAGEELRPELHGASHRSSEGPGRGRRSPRRRPRTGGRPRRSRSGRS